ncbi:MAG TPA: branched-chain amino acid ABC transporter permease, partial [Actinomycetota bacterium]
MAEAVAERAGRRLSGVDAFLWLLRIVLIASIAIGAFNSLTSGRLSGQQWRDLIVFGVAQGSIYALIALGYTMVYGVLRFINFAHGEVFMVGAMVGFVVGDPLSRTSLWTDMTVVAVVIMIVAAAAASTGTALLLERVAYRPLRGAPRLIPFITAIGASFFLQYSVAGLFGTGFKAYPDVPGLDGAFRILGFRVLKTQSLVIVVALVAMALLYVFVERTKAGRAIRAVSEDQEIARLMGIDVDRTIALVFAVGGAMAGVAGVLYGIVFGQVFFFTGFVPGIKAFTAAVLGGIGNIGGAMAGGLLLGGVESIGPSLILTGLGIPAANQLKDIVAFLTLVLVLIFRPTGILGERLA